MAEKTVQLKVAEAQPRDVGRGIARIDPEVMEKLGITDSGEVIKLVGKRETVTKVMPTFPEFRDQGLVQIDGITRENAQTGIDEKVKLSKAKVEGARKVTLSPLTLSSGTLADSAYLSRQLSAIPVVKGDRIQATFLGGRKQDFKVSETIPFGAVLLTPETTISLTGEGQATEARLTYEDIGGLGDQVKRIREMIELPLRFPQIFSRLGIEPPKGVLLYGPPGCGKTLIARVIANETDAYFLQLSGPQIMHKFYGECVAGDTFILTNGDGLTEIQEADLKRAHTIAALEMENKKVRMMSVADKFDKGIQKTMTILTPYGYLTLTPTSKLLVLKNGKPKWSFMCNVGKSDYVAIAKKLPVLEEKVPNLIDFLSDNTYLRGENVKRILNYYIGNQKIKDAAAKLNVNHRTFEGWKYRKVIPARTLKKLKEVINNINCFEFKLLGKGKIPTKMSKDIAYLLGLLIGDGHLRSRRSSEGRRVTTTSFTNADKKIVKEYKKILKEQFDIRDIKYDGHYGYYFSSSSLGDLFHNLGIPVKNKSRTASIPIWTPFLPEEFRAYFLRGLYDADGYVHLVKSGRQVVYYTMSGKLAMGIKMLLLQFKIQATMRRKRDGTYEVTINNYKSIERFKNKIGFNNELRKKRLYKNIKVNYHKPSLDRVPVTKFVREVAMRNGLSLRRLLRNGINVNTNGLTEEQIKRFLELIKERENNNDQDIAVLQNLINKEILWSKIKEIKESEAHVYDFTVPGGHNFIANGFIVHNSEAHLRSVFEEAKKNAPAILFLDELDAIAPKREELGGEKQVERRVVAQLLALMDGLESRGEVIIIGATNLPNILDPALRRPGRFDREITISIPDKNGRKEILTIHTRGMPLSDDVDLERLAFLTHGFVGADLAALAREAAMYALRRLMPKIDFEQEVIPQEALLSLEVTMDDFLNALREIEPSAIREVFTEIPEVSFEEIGGLDDIKRILSETICEPLYHPEVFARAKTRPAKGILLTGKPGIGKTLLAKAIAKEAEVNFIAISGPQLLSKYIGESERGVREVFKKAKQAAPCILFFDEIEALVPKRGKLMGEQVTERVVSQFLTEMDGIEELKGVVILASTNRPDLLDPALLRPGRFDYVLELPKPDQAAREEIFKIHTKGKPLGGDVSLTIFAKETEDLTGADIASICQKASLLAIREFLASNGFGKPFGHELRAEWLTTREKDLKKLKITKQHFRKAMEKTE